MDGARGAPGRSRSGRMTPRARVRCRQATGRARVCSGASGRRVPRARCGEGRQRCHAWPAGPLRAGLQAGRVACQAMRAGGTPEGVGGQRADPAPCRVVKVGTAADHRRRRVDFPATSVIIIEPVSPWTKRDGGAWPPRRSGLAGSDSPLYFKGPRARASRINRSQPSRQWSYDDYAGLRRVVTTTPRIHDKYHHSRVLIT